MGLDGFYDLCLFLGVVVCCGWVSHATLKNLILQDFGKSPANMEIEPAVHLFLDESEYCVFELA